MRLNRVAIAIVAAAVTVSCGDGDSGVGGSASGITASPIAELGRKIFFDTNLSSNSNQSCGTCHDPANGFADPRVSTIAPISEGSIGGTFGDRSAPTVAYASFSPQFGVVAAQDQTPETDSKYQGGQFLDGRATDLIEQAKAPFLNPVEMNNTNETEVVSKVQNSIYSTDFLSVFGVNAFDDTTTAYNNIATAIAAFEASSAVNKFTSKFDDYLAGKYTMTASEQRGFELFKNPNKAKCANCHTVGNTSAESLFTNFKYYNVGTPINFQNPAWIADNGFVDNGLGANGVIDAADQATEAGKFKVPTLRNIELTAPYMHNGVYETLEEVIQHYDIFATGLIPEVNANLASEMGDLVNGTGLGLDPNQDYPDLVNFMKTLTDGWS